MARHSLDMLSVGMNLLHASSPSKNDPPLLKQFTVGFSLFGDMRRTPVLPPGVVLFGGAVLGPCTRRSGDMSLPGLPTRDDDCF